MVRYLIVLVTMRDAATDKIISEPETASVL